MEKSESTLNNSLVFAVNGKKFEVSTIHPSTTLLEFLRSHTPFKGAKLSCGEGLLLSSPLYSEFSFSFFNLFIVFQCEYIRSLFAISFSLSLRLIFPSLGFSFSLMGMGFSFLRWVWVFHPLLLMFFPVWVFLFL